METVDVAVKDWKMTFEVHKHPIFFDFLFNLTKWGGGA